MNKINLYNFNFNVFDLFKNQTPICVFGDIDDHHGLAVAWGSLGYLWKKNIATVYIKPTRYSYNYAEKKEYFSLVWFNDDIHSKVLKTFGTLSGKEYNKDELSGIIPYELDGTIGYYGAKMIITCKIIYRNEIKPNNIIDSNVHDLNVYQDHLYHHEYIGEIIGCYVEDHNDDGIVIDDNSIVE